MKSIFFENHIFRKKVDLDASYKNICIASSEMFGVLDIQLNLNCPGVECMHLDCDK